MKRTTLFVIVLIIGGLMGILSFYYWQKNIFSKDVLRLEIIGPAQVNLLEEVEYIVKFKNNGNIRLDEPRLIFEYPSHSLPIDGDFLRIVKDSQQLGGPIYPGEERSFSFQARLLGQEGEKKIARASLRFQPKNLRAHYQSTTSHTTIIRKVPLTFEFDLPLEIEPEREIKIRLNYFSNVDYPLSNLRIKTDYPSGFEFIQAVPQALEEEEWPIALLNKAQGGRIEISGRLTGQIGEIKIFRAKIGIWQRGEFVLLKETHKGIVIARPSIHISQTINNNPFYVASLGEWLHYRVFFRNLGRESLNNLFLIIRLEGDLFDFQTLKDFQGKFLAEENSIIFDWRRIPKMRLLLPDEEGEIDFWIKLKEEGEILTPAVQNLTIKTKVNLNRIEEEFVTKVNSKIVVSQEGYFDDEVFGNSGPLPPRIGQTTSYTVIWRIKNYYNNVKNIRLKAKLPPNSQLTGKIFPEEQATKFAFDSHSREIVWKVENLIAGQGVGELIAPWIAFQIKFTPEVNQKGQTPEIISKVIMTGQDEWTTAILEAESKNITTATISDPDFAEEKGIVQ